MFYFVPFPACLYIQIFFQNRLIQVEVKLQLWLGVLMYLVYKFHKQTYLHTKFGSRIPPILNSLRQRELEKIYIFKTKCFNNEKIIYKNIMCIVPLSAFFTKPVIIMFNPLEEYHETWYSINNIVAYVIIKKFHFIN